MFQPVILRLARRYIARRFLQSLLFVVGVALGVSAVVAIDLANNSASRAFSLSTESLNGRATHQIIGGPSGVPTALYRQLRLELGLTAVAPVVTGYVQSPDLGDRPLRLLGVDPFAEPPFREYLNVVETEGGPNASFDALNRFITEPNTVLLGQTLADRFNIAIGDTLTLSINGGLTDVVVIGLLKGEDSASAEALDDLLLTDIASAQMLIGKAGAISRIDLILPDPALEAQIRAILPPNTQLITLNEEDSTLNQMTEAFNLNLQALSLLALVVGVFLIYNTVTFSVVQRRPVIGILRSLGTTRRQIFALILGEALLLGVIGTVLGLALGLIFGRGAVALVSQVVNDIYFSVNVQKVAVNPVSLFKGVGVGILASFFAALVPSYEATRTVPAGVMRRSQYEQGARRLLPVMTALAVVMNLVGVVLLQIPTQDIIISFAALFCIIVGSALFTPIVLVFFMRIIVPLTTALFGVLGRMAPRAVSRSLSRTAIAVAALTIAVSVIVGVSVMISSFRTTVVNWLDNTLLADIYISPPSLTASSATANLDPALKDALAAVEGVANVATVREAQLITPDYPDLPPATASVVDDDDSEGTRPLVWLNRPDGDYMAALQDGQILVSEPFAYRRGITPENNTLRILTDEGVVTFTVAGVYYDYTTDQGRIFMLRPTYDRYFDDPYISALAVTVADGYAVGEIIDQLERETLAGTNLIVQSNRDLRLGALEIFDRAFAITTALQLLAILVAFIGILSALLSLQLEHIREFGVMRANGMTPAQLWRFTFLQTGLMGAVAGLLALPIGVVLALVLVVVVNVRSFGWTMQMQLRTEDLAMAFAIAIIAALVAGAYPAWRLSRLAVAEALRSE